MSNKFIKTLNEKTSLGKIPTYRCLSKNFSWSLTSSESADGHGHQLGIRCEVSKYVTVPVKNEASICYFRHAAPAFLNGYTSQRFTRHSCNYIPALCCTTTPLAAAWALVPWGWHAQWPCLELHLALHSLEVPWAQSTRLLLVPRNQLLKQPLPIKSTSPASSKGKVQARWMSPGGHAGLRAPVWIMSTALAHGVLNSGRRMENVPKNSLSNTERWHTYST